MTNPEHYVLWEDLDTQHCCRMLLHYYKDVDMDCTFIISQDLLTMMFLVLFGNFIINLIAVKIHLSRQDFWLFTSFICHILELLKAPILYSITF